MAYIADVNNVPNGITERYIVANMVVGELWFWGAWDDPEKAQSVAKEIDGVVVENEHE